ncbi:MAG: hypothetical protein V3573_13665 [Desulfovibrionaceae bacterium]
MERESTGMERHRVENLDLPNDHGNKIRLTGEVVAEDMHFNDATGMLTVEKLYDAGGGRLAYAAISAVDDRRDRRAYVIEEKDDRCIVSNGSVAMDLNTSDLLHLLSLAVTESERNAVMETRIENIRRKLAANA